MTTQTGIQVSQELQELFSKANQKPAENSLRLIKATISEDVVAVFATYPAEGDWQNDFHLLSEAGNKEAAYLFYRIDQEEASEKSGWVLFTYIPDGAKVKDRMIYAATKATVIRQLGASNILQSIHSTSQEDLSLEGYQQYLAQSQAEAPLTEEESIRQQLKKTEEITAYGTTSRSSHVSNVNLTLDPETYSILDDYLAGNTNLVMLDIDSKTEKVHAIDSGCSSQVAVDQLAYLFPTDTPRFTIYKYKADDMTTDVFIYSCPNASPIRDRMIYSSSRAILYNQLAAKGFDIQTRLEVDDPYDLTEEFLTDRICKPKEAQPQRELLGQSEASFKPAPPSSSQGTRRPRTRKPTA
ncbi:Twinfilin-1 [Entomophthora muscae]|uniref:Twinfilin-1 n=1 Tax=Entomophthora muscae TaxID=34485 RepID=A0ACC2SR25_9FUNG|nr:Twinfilin-1 [Entomophthora muscae]